jgi:hypothetical protein
MTYQLRKKKSHHQRISGTAPSVDTHPVFSYSGKKHLSVSMISWILKNKQCKKVPYDEPAHVTSASPFGQRQSKALALGILWRSTVCQFCCCHTYFLLTCYGMFGGIFGCQEHWYLLVLLSHFHNMNNRYSAGVANTLSVSRLLLLSYPHHIQSTPVVDCFLRTVWSHSKTK